MFRNFFWFFSGLVVGMLVLNWHNTNFVSVSSSNSNTSTVSIDYEFIEESDEEFIARMEGVLNTKSKKVKTSRQVIRQHSQYIPTTYSTGFPANATIPNIPTSITEFDNRSKSLSTEIAIYYGVLPSLVHAVIKQESGWYAQALSHAGAIGMMQIIPSTGKSACGLLPKDLYKRKLNLTCGVLYLKTQLVKFNRVDFALCAYNAGPGRIGQYNGCPPYNETITYRDKILADWGGNINVWRYSNEN